MVRSVFSFSKIDFIRKIVKFQREIFHSLYIKIIRQKNIEEFKYITFSKRFSSRNFEIYVLDYFSGIKRNSKSEILTDENIHSLNSTLTQNK